VIRTIKEKENKDYEWNMGDLWDTIKTQTYESWA
jgi:hypothetical protein